MCTGGQLGLKNVRTEEIRDLVSASDLEGNIKFPMKLSFVRPVCRFGGWVGALRE